MGHEKLGHYYTTNFAMKQYHNWDLGYLDSILPWERYIYIDMLEEYLKELEEKNRIKEKEARDRQAAIERRLRENNPRNR